MLHPRIVLQAILSGGQRDLNLVTGTDPAALLSSSIALDLALVWFCSCFRRRPSLLRRSNMTLFRTVLVSSGLFSRFLVERLKRNKTGALPAIW
jgi:hypothetical protein